MNHGGFPARQLFEKIPASWDWWKNPSEIMLCSHDPWRSFLSTDPRASQAPDSGATFEGVDYRGLSLRCRLQHDMAGIQTGGWGSMGHKRLQM